MRFYSDGPDIPDSLLELRDKGRVVFLCGAGVSMSSGMPSFLELTEYVVNFFDPPKDSIIYQEFVKPLREGAKNPKVPLDQVFYSLYRDYGKDEVDELVTKKLTASKHYENKNSNHKIISEVSTGPSGRPQIVTTNFDLLFEQSESIAPNKISLPPNFPNMEVGSDLPELTYLHGRLQDGLSKQAQYVLSSADFGRAYLSEAWATKFMKSLLKRYTVVLLGYSADDPPVNYLLQGLNQGSRNTDSSIFAFDIGRLEEIESKWIDRGVTPIAYNEHETLWSTLRAWAERAKSPREWRNDVLTMSMRGPRALEPFERGQVVHLVSTTPGARLFAKADPSPPAEWICVFDSGCRSDKKATNFGFYEHDEEFDPYYEYSLDNDPAPNTKQFERRDIGFINVLKWNSFDETPTSLFQITGAGNTLGWELPKRLEHLSNWIAGHSSNPVISWWSARKPGIHQYLVTALQQKFRNNSEVLTAKVRALWDAIIAYQTDPSNFFWDGRWFSISDRLKKEGWSPSVLMDLESVSTPSVKIERPYGIAKARPPMNGWDKTQLSEIANFRVKFPERHNQTLEVPNDSLIDVFNILERSIRTADLLNEEFDIDSFNQPSCYPKRDVEGSPMEDHAFFDWFMALFLRLISEKPEAAKAFSTLWSLEKGEYSRELKLFALNQATLFDANEAAEQLINLSQPMFWSPNTRRELLFLVEDRWLQFSKANQRGLISRLLNGPDKASHWSDDEHLVLKNKTACLYLQYLVAKGVTLTPDEQRKLDLLKSQIPKWDDRLATSYSKETYPTIRTIGVDETYDALEKEPIGNIVQKAIAIASTQNIRTNDKRPFSGLIKNNPRKALAALSHEARKGEFPLDFWRAIIEEFPEGVSARLLSVFVNRLRKLPPETLQSLSPSIGRWIQKNISTVYEINEHLALNAFDELTSAIIRGGEESTKSNLNTSPIRGSNKVASRFTFHHASYSPIGNALDGLLNVLNSLKLPTNTCIPQKVTHRIERLIEAPGDGSHHSVAILAHQLCWLYSLDPQWTACRVVPWFHFDSDYSEAAWNGFLYRGRLPEHELLDRMAPLLVQLFPQIHKWSWETEASKVAAQLVMEMAIFRLDSIEHVTVSDVRNSIRNMNSTAKQTAINRLATIGQQKDNGWKNLIVPFINEVWPRERKFRNSSLSTSWVTLALDSTTDFPDVLKAIYRFLTPIRGSSHPLYSLTIENDSKPALAACYPDEVLTLLDKVVAGDTSNLPYELSQILELLEDAEPKLSSDPRYLRLMHLIEHT